ncbi:MAG: low molecular weight phosphatase family protein [Cetobacterium sp.]|uniref:arsenate-mycothiol transferase ArsC n=1 Tax=Cetobacterium sp. TaxID=2071632 RepID=UPI003F374BC2
MKTIAFVCKGNSFKSIICERFAKELTNDFIIVSAGTNPAEKVNDEGAKIMEAKGLSMFNYKPHPLDELPENIDYLVKMGCAVECPFVPAKETIDFDMDKYPASTFEEKVVVVDLLEKKVKEFIKSISQ